MKINRRKFLLGSASAAALLLGATNVALAVGNPGTLKRSNINLQIPAWYEREHIWCDLVRGSTGSPAGYTGYGGQSSDTDAMGYANVPSPPGIAGGLAALPTTVQYGGYYVMIGKGAGQITVNPVSIQTWTALAVGVAPTQDGITYAAGFNFTSFSNGTFSVTDSGSGWRIILTRTDHVVAGDFGNGLSWKINTTNVASGGYVTDVHMYRIDDETDFLAGNWYNRRWKQTLIDLNPATIRCMNWTTGAGELYAWGNRPPPTYFSSWAGANLNCIRYGTTTFGTSDHTVYSLSGTAQTPGTYQQGELVYCAVGGAPVTAAGTNPFGDQEFMTVCQPDSINLAHTLVASPNGSAMHVGDIIQFYFVSGMTKLNLQVATIQTVGVPNANSFTVNIDSRTYGTLDSGAYALYITLNVAGRGAAPVRTSFGAVPIGSFGGIMYAGAGTTRPFNYDKNIPASIDSAGNVTFGVWTLSSGLNGQTGAAPSSLNIEYCLKLINELDAMIVSQGLTATKGPIHPWINFNCYGMCSTDANYTQANHVGIGMVDIMLNGSSALGISGIPARCTLFCEYSNETWNIGGFRNYHSMSSSGRWGFANVPLEDFNDTTVLRAVQNFQDVRAAFPSAGSKIKFILGGLEVNGLVSSGASIVNWPRVFGDATLFADSAATATVPPGANPVYYGTAYGSTNPANFYWGFATAPYFDPSGAWNAANFTNSLNAWITNGQKTISTVTNGYPTHIVTTAPHGYSNGDLVVLTNLVEGAGDNWNGLFTPMFGFISNVTSNSFDINLDSTTLASISAGNVTRVNGTDQEAVYTSYMQWMIGNGASQQDINSVYSRLLQYCAELVPLGLFHVNYEGWEEMSANQTNSTPYTDALAFLGSCKRSQVLATMLTTLMNKQKSVYGSLMPSVFTQEDPGIWGFLFQDSYGFSRNGSQWNFSPAWTAMCNYNATAGSMTLNDTPT